VKYFTVATGTFRARVLVISTKMSTAHTETIKFEPHPSAITNAGEYAYHGIGFAFC
jgi:hypothetical protein